MADGENTLREFLTSRRAALHPGRTGLPVPHGPRRVPGLRREEVAALAGVSAAYYTKLEQGRIGRISDEVLSAVEKALQLDELERLHFRALVRNAGHRPAPVKDVTARARPELVAMIEALDPVPALIHGPRLDVLAVNRTAKLLIDDFDALPVRDRNLARWTFLNPRARTVYAAWETVAPQVAAVLRHLTVDRPADPVLHQLVGEIALASPEFVRYWAEYRLYAHSHGTKRFFNETVGELALHYEMLTLPGDTGQRAVVFTAERGSPAEEKLRLLAAWNEPSPSPADRRA
ncbi:helix-turn-helix transcriptional regulator [Streptomyces sp. NBC_01476]|uniref:helix-turn-helix domain-containing protein n=1 Tax=Streptomyces sp. NBC_01476 TaxID=2903881 RepID=UPI002E35405F|nr:helix-turn-helix transcriptional regulator [Streptomyces sp. NBC_01476]